MAIAAIGAIDSETLKQWFQAICDSCEAAAMQQRMSYELWPLMTF